MLSEKDLDEGVIYATLIHAVKSNSGIGFHNNDQGHMAYMKGAEDGGEGLGDDKNNSLYKMLVLLSDAHGKGNGTQVRNWREFCQLAVIAYCEAKGLKKPEWK